MVQFVVNAGGENYRASVSAGVTGVRPAAVAGRFYRADAEALRTEIEAMLAAVPPTPAAVQPKAMIVPHAGYLFSGAVAATAYARLRPWRQQIRRVVLLGPTHRVAVRGLALPGCGEFATPLGRVSVDQVLVQAVSGLPQVIVHPGTHAEEHALEVQLPFLQVLLPRFSLLPLAVGDASPAAVAEVLERLWGGPETLILISSDLSHYLPYAMAEETDRESVARILQLQPTLHHQQACGATPINGLLRAAAAHGLEPELLDRRNSGDTAGDRSRVVGYASLAFNPRPPEQLRAERQREQLGQLLLRRARAAIAAALGQPGDGAGAEAGLPELQQPAATFVTLTQAGDLRGCIGSLEAHRPLGEDVAANAVAAACRDPRFLPLTLSELARTRVEVSLLTPAEPLTFSDEDDALAQLQPGVDGLIFRIGSHRATFLPQVWESLPTPRVFLAHLKQKAGLPADFWSPEVSLSRYRVEKWKERLAEGATPGAGPL
ncbi:MAG: hypothetical protein RIR00_592 [Pseudomonadota bacterium]|jgi:AmmeMemoRadiSam system protein B/AmmeMemoRadiSam system protein A